MEAAIEETVAAAVAEARVEAAVAVEAVAATEAACPEARAWVSAWVLLLLRVCAWECVSAWEQNAEWAWASMSEASSAWLTA